MGGRGLSGIILWERVESLSRLGRVDVIAT